MKQFKDVISAHLRNFINRSFHNGVFPNILEIAKRIPIFKSESRVVYNSYIPISLLSNIGEITEKLMHKLFYSFLETQNCYYPVILTKCVNQQCTNVNNQTTQLDEGKYCAEVFVDLKKAFDTVDHNILLQARTHCEIFLSDYFINFGLMHISLYLI